jgi:GNAT superfamily N-acetyltransferase
MRISFRLFFPRFARVFAGKAFALGAAQRVEGFHGTALWLAPGIQPDDGALVPFIQETVAADRRAEVIALFAKIRARHLAGPHWYLPLIGIDPRHQGRGLGSILLQKMLTTIDGSGTPVCLEATNPRNIPFYERHGFQCPRRDPGRLLARAHLDVSRPALTDQPVNHDLLSFQASAILSLRHF